MRYFIAALLVLALDGWSAWGHGMVNPLSGSVEVGFGLGKNVLKNQIAGTHETFERAGFLGYRWTFLDAVFVQPEVGGFLVQGPNRKGSFWAGGTLGLKIPTEAGITGYFGVGPVFMATPDNVVLTGHLQWEPWAAICLDSWVEGCLRWTHFSNCHGCPLIGGREPNIGIDLIGAAFHF